MRILHITPAYHPAIQWGGPAVSVRLLAREQKKLGAKVEVYTTALGLPGNRTQVIEVDGLPVHYFRFWTFRRWFVSMPLLRELWKQRNEFDVFHIHLVWDPISWMAGTLLRCAGKRIVCSPRGTVEAALIDKKNPFLKRVVYALFVRNLFRAAHAFHFTAQDEKEKFIAFTGITPKRSAVIINPFDAAPFEERVKNKEYDALGLEQGKYFLYFGRLNWKKRLEVLLGAFAEFARVHPGYKVVCAGAGDAGYVEKIMAAARDTGIEKEFVCIPRSIPVYGGLKIALFQNAAAFVVPSHSENFGFVAVEAMASGIPLIISDGVAIRDMVLRHNAGRVFQGSGVSDREAAKALLAEMEYVHDTAHRAELVKNGKALVAQEFDNKKIAAQVIQLYQ